MNNTPDLDRFPPVTVCTIWPIIESSFSQNEKENESLGLGLARTNINVVSMEIKWICRLTCYSERSWDSEVTKMFRVFLLINNGNVHSKAYVIC